MAKAREFRKLKAKRKKAKKENKKFKRSGQNYLTVVPDNEKKKRQKLQELEDISQEPIECCQILLDANIIAAIFFDDVDAGARLKNYLKKKPFWPISLLFLTLDRVILEFIDMKKGLRFGAEKYEYDEVCGLLSSLGTFQARELDTRSEYARRAEELHMKKKYSGKDGKPLSLVDCYLLEYAIEYSCKLVTRDKGLINATKKEIRLRFGESELTGGTSPGVFKPW